MPPTLNCHRHEFRHQHQRAFPDPVDLGRPALCLGSGAPMGPDACHGLGRRSGARCRVALPGRGDAARSVGGNPRAHRGDPAGACLGAMVPAAGGARTAAGQSLQRRAPDARVADGHHPRRRRVRRARGIQPQVHRLVSFRLSGSGRPRRADRHCFRILA